jgi:hypothetical protein
MITRSDFNQESQEIPNDFVSLAEVWCTDQSAILLSFVWSAYDILTEEKPLINPADLERSITQLLEPRIRKAMSGYEPFYVQHGPFERETMQAQPAQPPQYDLAFVHNADERIMWPLEAKVLISSNAISEYVAAIKGRFLKYRYSPFSSQAAMLGYLLSGNANPTFESIARNLKAELILHSYFPTRNHRISTHTRRMRARKPYPSKFLCHHLLFLFPQLKRSKPRAKRKKRSTRRSRIPRK